MQKSLFRRYPSGIVGLLATASLTVVVLVLLWQAIPLQDASLAADLDAPFQDQGTVRVSQEELRRPGTILVSSAEHLDADGRYRGEITAAVRSEDGFFSTPIRDRQLVRVRFERELERENDITVVPRILSGDPRIQVSDASRKTLVARFGPLVPLAENKVSLAGLEEATDTFVLEITGGDVQFDLIIDPLPPPAVTDLYPAGQSFNTSQEIEINATVTDADGVDVVQANVTYPNGTVEQVALTSTGGNYTATFTIPKNIGRFNVTIIANDTSGNANTTERTNFTTTLGDPTSLNGLQAWYDAGDNATLYTDTGCSTQVSADLQEVLCWENKAGGSNATVVSGKSGARYRSNSTELISGSTVLRFNKSNESVYGTGIDIRATTLEDISLFAVYRPRTNDTSDQGQGLWGNDDGSWDRFYYSLFDYNAGLGTDGIDDGLISLGGASSGLAIDGAGIVDTVFLLTVIYNGNVSGGTNSGPVNGSQVYFDGDLQTPFTDESHATDAQTQLFIGRDGDNGYYDGDIAEFIVYEGLLGACEIESINNYLGPKYGKDFSGISDSYGFGAPHNTSINGISKYGGDCNVTVTTASAASSIATLSDPSSLDLNDTLTFAHDNGGFSLVAEAPENYTHRINQSWRVDVDNEPGTVSVSFDLETTGIILASSDFALLIDPDTNFSNATEHTTGYSVSGNVVTFTGANFTDGEYFSLAVTEKAPAVAFIDPTPADGTYISEDTFIANLSSDALGSDHYTFLDVDESLVLWLRMDAVNGSGDPTDESGSNNNGSLVADATINGTGKFGDAGHFDGSGDAIDIADHESLRFGTGNFTFSLWFRPNAVPSSAEQLLCKRVNGLGNYEVQVESGGKIRSWIGDSGGGAANIDSVTTISANSWYHVLLTRHGGTLYMYVNGMLENQTASTHNVTSSSVLRLGQDTGGSSEYFSGAIDEVLVFNRSMGTLEVLALYNATVDQHQSNFTSLAEGSHTLTGYAVGENGKKNQTETRTVTVDTITPGISFISSTEANDSFFARDWILVNVSVTESNEANSTFFLYNSSGSQLNATVFTDSTRSVNFTSLANGQYSYNVTVFDLTGKTNSTETREITLDTIAPNVTDPEPMGETFLVGNVASINATVADNIGIDTVTANVTFPNGSVSVIVLSHAGGSVYSGNITVPKVAGVFNITFRANDTTGNVNDSMTGSFVSSITDPTDLSSLRAWYDAADNATLYTDEGCSSQVTADGDPVLCWRDKSAYAANATNVSGKGIPEFATDTFNSLSVVSFNKTEEDTLRHVLSSQYASDFTIFVVIQSRDSSPATYESFFSNGEPADAAHFQIDYVEAGNAFRYGASAKFNFENFSNEIKLYSVTHNGTNVELFNEGKSVNMGTTTEGRTFEHYRVNQNRAGDRHHESFIGEIILYDRVLDACERESVNVYLGNKYGKDFFGTRDNYGFGAPHDNDINGIGKFPSNCSATISFTDAASSFLTISNPSSLDLNDSLTFAHDNGGLLALNSAPSTYWRANQSWRMDEDGDVGTVTVSFDLSDNTSLLSYDNFVLLTDDDTDFSNANVSGSGSASGNSIEFTGIDLANGEYVTLGFNDTTAPSVSALLPAQDANYTITTAIEIAANVTDAIGVDTVLANVTFPNGSTQVLILASSAGSTYNISYTIPGSDGRYNVTFIANDTSGNTNGTEATFFNARNVSVPDIEFVLPTPANDSVVGGSFTINVSSSDTDGDHYALVDVDGTARGWWRFDVVNGSGDPTDESGSGNNGSLVGDAKINGTGKFGDVVHFDGSGDYVNLPASNVLVPDENAWSISTWFNANSIASGNFGNRILTFTSSSSSSVISLTLGNLDRVQFFYRDSGGSGTTENVTAISTGAWYHYAAIYNGTHYLLYVNGTLQRTIADTIDEPSFHTARIGANPDGTDEFFDGAIDEVLVLNRSLNGSEVMSLYNATVHQYRNGFSSLAEGRHTFIGYAVSTNGKKNQTEERTVTVDTTPPSVTELLPEAGTTIDKSGTVEIAANVTDAIGVDTVLANVTHPNGSIQVLILSLSQGSKYNASFGLPGTNGTFNVTVIANDTVGNSNETEKTSFVGMQLVYPGGVSDNIQLWLDAGKNGTVYQDSCSGNVSSHGNVTGCWKDRSGKDHHVESSGTDRPILQANGSKRVNFNPVIDFDGSDDFLEDADGEDYLNGASEFSTFVVVDAATASFDGYIFNAENDSQAEAPWGLRFDDEGALSGRDDTLKTGINTGTPELYEGNEDNLASAIPLLASVHWTSGQAPTLFVNGRSVAVHPSTTKSGTLTGGNYVRIGHQANQDFWNGSIAELVHYQTRLNVTSQYKVASYLAVKYGITLDSAVNYVDSDNATIYASQSTHENYTNDIAGVGVDNTSDLVQAQSRSVNPDSIVIMQNASSMENKEFLIWGNDNASLAENGSNIPLGLAKRLGRTWRVDRTGAPGPMTILVNLSGLTVTGTEAANFSLIIDPTDADFTSGAVTLSATSFSGNVVRFDSVNFTGDDYFSLGTSNDTQGPNVTEVIASPNSTFDLAQEVEINATVADSSGVSSVRANVTLPNASVQQITLTLLAGDTYNGSFTTPSLIGNYTVRILANDTVGNVNSTETASFEVMNDVPDPSSVQVNGGSDITLAEGTNKTIVGTGTITDLNGYGHLSSVTGYLFLTTTGAGASDNRSTHYTSSCVSNGDGSGNTESYNCTFNVSHYAVPTDSGANQSATNWTFLMAPLDAEGAGTNGTDVVEVETLLAFSISPSLISFGSLNLSTNTTDTNQQVNVTNRGNVQLDVVMSGTNLSCSPGIIPVTFLEYEDNPFSYGVGIDLLESGVELDLDVSRGHQGNETPGKVTYYGFGVPGTAVGGSCSGTVVLTGQADPDGD